MPLTFAQRACQEQCKCVCYASWVTMQQTRSAIGTDRGRQTCRVGQTQIRLCAMDIVNGRSSLCAVSRPADVQLPLLAGGQPACTQHGSRQPASQPHSTDCRQRGAKHASEQRHEAPHNRYVQMRIVATSHTASFNSASHCMLTGVRYIRLTTSTQHHDNRIPSVWLQRQSVANLQPVVKKRLSYRREERCSD